MFLTFSCQKFSTKVRNGRKGKVRHNQRKQKPVNTRKGFYPDDIAGTFWRACRRAPERIRSEANRWICVDEHPDGEGPGTSAD